MVSKTLDPFDFKKRLLLPFYSCSVLFIFYIFILTCVCALEKQLPSSQEDWQKSEQRKICEVM